MRRRLFLWAVAVIVTLRESVAYGFRHPGRPILARRLEPLRSTGNDEEIERQLAKARELLAKTKAKLGQEIVDDAKADESGDGAVPFFATVTPGRENVIKSRDEKTGLITTDGEKMAQLSEDEQWEGRPISEVFENEIEDDVYSMAAQQLADRDVAMSIFNLRKSMMNEDYRAIFDKKNRFIGEDT